MSFLPGLEPDFDIKKELRFIGGMPDLHQFDFVFISCSGGKDSHAMAYLLAELADRQGYNKEKMELLYADTGLEWHDTFDQVKRIGQAVGIKAIMVMPKYKLLDNVRRRWAKFNGLEWEDSRAEQSRAEQSRAEQSRADDLRSGKTGVWASPFPNFVRRFCTSDHKRFPIEQYVRSRATGLCGAEVTENNFRSNFMFATNSGGGICGIDHSPVSMQDFALLGESKNLNINISVNPFPRAHRRFCTGEGKNNAIFERVRNQSKAEDG